MKLIEKMLKTDVLLADDFADLGRYLECLSKSPESAKSPAGARSPLGARSPANANNSATTQSPATADTPTSTKSPAGTGVTDLPAEDVAPGRLLWVLDSNTELLIHPTPKPVVTLKAGEGSKTLKNVETILEAACEHDMSRTDAILGMGGGVVTDTAAFAASVYKRGCRLILVPTSLLSMVDASIGGKTGVNFLGAKNIVGTFYPADTVVICVDYLKSLPDREYKSGLAEVIKTAFLARDDELLKELVMRPESVKKRSPDELKHIITLCVKTKSSYVREDLEEKTALRRALNLGHTFGHALESLKRMSVSHGDAVAWGMACALRAGAEEHVCEGRFAETMIRLLSGYGFDTEYKIKPSEWDEYRKYLYKDKKNLGGELRFVLLAERGFTVEKALDTERIRRIVSA